MTSPTRVLIAAPILSLLASCASTPDPAVVCSAEWIAPRAEKAIGRIEKRAKTSIKTLSKVSKTVAEGKSPGPFQMIAFTGALSKMRKELTHGQGMKDLKTVAKTCDDPEIVNDAMKSLLERQGVSDEMISRIERNPIYESLISNLAKPEPVSPS